MGGRFILTDYVESALSRSAYEKLEDGSYAGTIPECPGVVSFATDLRACQDELRSTLEDWVLVGLKLGHTLPVGD
jgi:predicted RNase H-like HicB family nuclease